MATKTDSVILKTILENITLLLESIKVGNAENGKKTEEISMIARHNNQIETEDESSGNGRKNTRINVRESSENSRASRSRESSPFISSETPTMRKYIMNLKDEMPSQITALRLANLN